MTLTNERKKQICVTIIAVFLVIFASVLYRYLKYQPHQVPKIRITTTTTTVKPQIIKYFEPKYEDGFIEFLPDPPSKKVVTKTEASQNTTRAVPKPGLDPSEGCLHCLCQTINGCQPVKCMKNYTCGIYEISKFYWIDGGRLTVNEENSPKYADEKGEVGDYLRCVNNEECARYTVIKYMQLYQRDCNNDGIIDCRDYIPLHLLGPKGCRSKPLAVYHKMRMKSCLLQ
ncbi:uncharacterized protein LOC106091337 [Stomoxys calcitrans]|uniref:lysozyme n=1 Tax=Stomoxys calcitrans TaxID=35570 RepID=A0A1I8PJT7_STOCA|nr:uncharacterized protein LOC106091337 [Stomoxys calcitrans]